MTPSCLIEQRWLPMITSVGPVECGLEGVLVRAHEMTPSFPSRLQEAAILRLLMAIVIDATGYPQDAEEWSQRWRQGSFDPQTIGEYLATYSDRFELFSQDGPAFQVAGLTALSGQTKPSSLLVPQAATGNNVPLFSSRTENDPESLSFAEAARAVIAAQAWDTAAIKTGALGDPVAKMGKTTGNPTGPLGQLGIVIPTGRSLFETLLLNLPIRAERRSTNDRPWWARDPVGPGWQTRPATGLLDLLTWQSRRIRMIPEQAGDGTLVVRQVIVAAGDRLELLPHDIEPHTVWKAVEKPKPGQSHWRAVRHQSGKAIWRGMAGLLAVAAGGPDGSPLQTSRMLEQIRDLRADRYLPEDFPLAVVAVGVEYGNQSAVVENVIDDAIPLPVQALSRDGSVREALLTIVAQVEELRVALNKLADNVRVASGGDPVAWDQSQRPGDQMLAQFDPVVRRILAGMQSQPENVVQGLQAWMIAARRIVLAAAYPVIAAAPPEGFLGRWKGRTLVTVPLAENWFRGRVTKTLGNGPGQQMEGAR